MKNLEEHQLETLLQIIGTTPSHQIAHFTQGGEILVDKIHQYCMKQDYRYQINCTDSDFYERIKEKYLDSPIAHIINFSLQRRVYKIQAKEYNVLFVSSVIPPEDRSEFLKKSHQIIRSAGIIVIFVSKKDYHEHDDWMALLEEHLYVSTSTIDDLFEHYDIIISKRMHGWGK